jgi:hypothetical protein
MAGIVVAVVAGAYGYRLAVRRRAWTASQQQT